MSYDQDQRRQIFSLEMLPYPGLTIDMRKPSFAALDALTQAVLVLGGDFTGERLTPVDRMNAWHDLFTAFADSLVAWNLTDRGRPVPATRAGVLDQDTEFLVEVARTWYVMVVLRPLGQDTGEQTIDAHTPVDATADSDDLNTDDEAWLGSFQTTTITPEPEAGGLVEDFEMPEVEHDIAPVPAGPAPHPEIGTVKLDIDA